MEKRGILPMEQKALRKGTRGCLDAIVIDEAVARETKVGQQGGGGGGGEITVLKPLYCILCT